jgi:precorrin-8X/cobalt-precorrin-8 methylmutase
VTISSRPNPPNRPNGSSRPSRPRRHYEYIDDGPAIYADSFAIIRREARLAHLPANAERLAVRMIHGTGQVDLADDLVVHPDLVPSARAALRGGAPILCDATMVATGVTVNRLPRDNDVLCFLGDERVPGLAREWGTTRTAAAVSLWEPLLDGAVVAVGNAPTALFHLLEMLADGAPRPAAIVGCPVGFVGAAESKQALTEFAERFGVDVPYVTARGRRGGSAMTSSALNALAKEEE